MRLPVGQNLKDHPIFSFIVKTNGNRSATNLKVDLNGTNETNIAMYEIEGSGTLAQGRDRLIFFASKVGSNSVTRFFQGSCTASGQGTITITTYMTHGLTSTGVFGIDSNGMSVFEKPAYLQAGADNETATAFIEDMIDAITDPSTGFSLQTNLNTTVILSSLRSGNHYTGTAKAGTDDGRRGGTSVVDTNTKVYGVKNLFVTDASMHSDLPTGNTQAIVMVAAEAPVARILAYRGKHGHQFMSYFTIRQCFMTLRNVFFIYIACIFKYQPAKKKPKSTPEDWNDFSWGDYEEARAGRWR